MTLPFTRNLNSALCAFVKPSGGPFGAVKGFSAVESVISGICLAVRAALSVSFPFAPPAVLLFSDAMSSAFAMSSIQAGK